MLLERYPVSAGLGNDKCSLSNLALRKGVYRAEVTEREKQNYSPPQYLKSCG